jgi:hypothetical protein
MSDSQRDALKDVRDALASDDEISVFAAFIEAATALLPELAGLPDPELGEVALSIRALANKYNEVKRERGERAAHA